MSKPHWGIKLGFLLAPLVLGAVMIGHLSTNNNAAVAGSGNISEQDFQAGRTCEAIGKSVRYVLKNASVTWRGSSGPNGYVCFVEKPGYYQGQKVSQILVRMATDQTGRWKDPY